MSQHNHLFHQHLDKKSSLRAFDKLMLVFAFAYPLSAVPQIITVFSGDVAGVSMLSWLSFLMFATVFLIYSMIHKIKPMIITYAIWWLVDAAVVVGIIINS